MVYAPCTMMVVRGGVAALFAASISVATAFTTAEPPRIFSFTQFRGHYLDRTHSTSTGTTTGSFVCFAASSPSEENESTIAIPSFIVNPVLAQVYPSSSTLSSHSYSSALLLFASIILLLFRKALIAHNEKYGNPNIPLGCTDGKRCKTLRRLHFQNMLTEDETNLLTELGFRFHSFEDVYYECDFDEMLFKLSLYNKEFQTYQIPKKYEPDPELGAWVTMLRRLRQKNELPRVQIDKLDAVGFEWTSTRKCGSSFMKRYREVLSYLSKVVEAGGEVKELVYEDTEIMKWVDAQRQIYENGKLSESRAQYMDDLPGIDWRNPISWG
ncbi:hypothetical protein ACHAXA_007738 [Cyclostephanos tholiformis]|uniref:Helicase-associated domain-containing protein n=1 Tax=Cyclostephanos tholiformis TaxID=382380 RepID=A0ABD3RYC9_9STRA